MKVTLYNAVSIDGLVTGKKDDVSWISEEDWVEYERLIKEKQAVIMGRRTFEFAGNDFPYKCKLNVVMTSQEKLHRKNSDNVWFTNDDLDIVLEDIAEKGFREVLLLGGSQLNSSFLNQGLLSEIILSIHPIILGEGLPLFDTDEPVNLEKLLVKEMEDGLVQVRYKVT